MEILRILYLKLVASNDMPPEAMELLRSMRSMKPRLSREKMMELMKNYCDGNYNRFGRELGVDPAHLYRFLKTGVGGGKKMIFSLMAFCEKNSLDYKNYIEM